MDEHTNFDNQSNHRALVGIMVHYQADIESAIDALIEPLRETSITIDVRVLEESPTPRDLSEFSLKEHECIYLQPEVISWINSGLSDLRNTENTNFEITTMQYFPAAGVMVVGIKVPIKEESTSLETELVTFSNTCYYCNTPVSVTEEVLVSSAKIKKRKKSKYREYKKTVVCPNESCLHDPENGQPLSRRQIDLYGEVDIK